LRVHQERQGRCNTAWSALARIGERCLDVIRFQVGKVTQHVVLRHALGEHGEDVGDPDAQSPDAGSAAALVRVHGDAFQEIHLWHSALSGAAKSTCPANGSDAASGAVTSAQKVAC
jgi:hypothetical protein